MTDLTLPSNDAMIHVRDTGPRDGPALVFANALGTDLRVWDALLPLLPREFRVIRYDMRGHGRSSAPAAPYHMGTLVADLAGVLDGLALWDAVVVGLSIGGIVAQGLAAERPELLRAMVLADTAVKIGTGQLWAGRIAEARAVGLEGMADAVMGRWFPPRFRRDAPEVVAQYRARFLETSVEGYTGGAAAIAETDLLESTSRLRLPTLVLCGAMDAVTPPDLVRETATLIPGAAFSLIPSAGHLPCVDAPELMAALITSFLDSLPERV